MIVRKDKTYEINSLFPNVNWYKDEDNYVIDETKDENKKLIEKIQKYSPHMELVIKDNRVIDVIPINNDNQIITNDRIDKRIISIAEALVDLDLRLQKLEKGE